MAGTNYTNYTIDYSDSTLAGKTPFTVEAESLNSTTSLYLIGQGYSRYGEYVNENFVKLLENFAARSAPVRATMGQLWYDGNTNTLKVYNNTAQWVEVGGGGSATYTFPAVIGTPGQVLTSNGNSLYWSTLTTGGTGTTYTQGAGITISGTQISVTKPLPATGGTIAGQMLYTDGSAPYWGNAPAGGGTSGITGVGATAPILSSGGTTTNPIISHSTLDGYLHVPATGTTSNGKVLTAGSTAGSFSWQTPSGGTGGTGTVTSVTLSGGSTGLTVSGSPITTSGTMTLAGTLAIANGGTGATSGAAALTALGGISQTSGDTRYVQKAVDQTMSGYLSVPTPTANAHAATKGYVDGRVPLTGTSGYVLTLVGTTPLWQAVGTSGTLAITGGGTGATTAAGALANLGGLSQATANTLYAPISGSTVGSVGSVAIMSWLPASFPVYLQGQLLFGATAPGSRLRYSTSTHYNSGFGTITGGADYYMAPTVPSGTWECMGVATHTNYSDDGGGSGVNYWPALFKRIA